MNYDIIISGGGLLGMIAAIGLRSNSISVAVVEKKTLPYLGGDNRAFAISQGSKQILENFGIWEFIDAYAEPILDICIQDGDSPITLHYTHEMVPMGYIVDGTAVWNMINNHFLSTLDLYSSVSYKHISCDSGYVEMILDNGQQLVSSLLICAEGKHSKLPDSLSVSAMRFNYKQDSIVCKVQHELHHQNLAVERFFPGGPFAILPTNGGYHSSVVWTEKSKISQMLMSLTDEEFLIELKKRFGSYLGDIMLASKITSYPLSFHFIKSLYKNRVLFTGDVAHSLHPIAGQGLNLGIRDVDVAVRDIAIAKATGIDIGSNYLLSKIARSRCYDSITMAIATDGINRIFSNRLFSAKVLRNFGLIIVENSTILKTSFIRRAMGFI